MVNYACMMNVVLAFDEIYRAKNKGYRIKAVHGREIFKKLSDCYDTGDIAIALSYAVNEGYLRADIKGKSPRAYAISGLTEKGTKALEMFLNPRFKEVVDKGKLETALSMLSNGATIISIIASLLGH